MVTISTDAAIGRGCRILLAPNCSLTRGSALAFVASLAVPTIGLGLYFAWRGLWPVLPFAGLEVALLAWAVHASRRHGSERESILVSDEQIVVERVGRHAAPNAVFPRYWARVKLRGPHRSLHPSRLVIESHGRACEVGRFLTEEERRDLARRLERLVGRTSESPGLAA